MVLHMVVTEVIIINNNNNVHIIIPLGIRNSNVDHNCWILSYFLPKHIHWLLFFFVLHFRFFFSVYKPVYNIVSFIALESNLSVKKFFSFLYNNIIYIHLLRTKKLVVLLVFDVYFFFFFFVIKDILLLEFSSKTNIYVLFIFILSFLLLVELEMNRQMMIDNKRKTEELLNNWFEFYVGCFQC